MCVSQLGKADEQRQCRTYRPVYYCTFQIRTLSMLSLRTILEAVLHSSKHAYPNPVSTILNTTHPVELVGRSLGTVPPSHNIGGLCHA
jgi:hypothetical protein